jgi:putative ABC transport system substrate-binding protein
MGMPPVESHMTIQIRRREFISLLGSTAVTWPLAARAQQSGRMRLIGVLTNFQNSDPAVQQRISAFETEIVRSGWTIGSNLQTEYRWAGGDPGKLRVLAAELVSSKPDVILVNGSPALSSLVQETRAIPIVFVNVADPVIGGFVMSLAKPGGNVTGFTNFEFRIGGKWLGLLKDVAPNLSRVAIMLDPTNPSSAGLGRTVETFASSFAIQTTTLDIANPAEIEPTIDAFASQSNGGLIVLPGGFTVTYRKQIIGAATKRQLPSLYPFRYFVADGGLMSYGVNDLDLYRQAARYVDRILKGEKAADLPVQAPTKFELVLNLKTAKTLGLAVPRTLLAIADEVIE